MKTFTYLIVLVFLFSSFTSFSQDSQEETAVPDNSLENQFREMKSSSNTYQIYKVVKMSSLDEFWKSVADSLKVDRDEVKSLKTEVGSLNAEVSNMESQIAERDTRLEEQEFQIEHMSFLGKSITKGSYVIVSWIIIFVLLFTAIILYFRFKSANRITVKAKNKYSELNEEFENHKKRARETESKIKRELQTEINTVQELKQKFGKA